MVKIPDLPSQHILSNRYDHLVIEERRQGFEIFLNMYILEPGLDNYHFRVCTHPLILGGPSMGLLVSFLQGTD